MLFSGGWRGHQSPAGELLDHLHEGSGDVRCRKHSAAVQQHEAGGGADSAGQEGRRHVRPLLQRLVSRSVLWRIVIPSRFNWLKGIIIFEPFGNLKQRRNMKLCCVARSRIVLLVSLWTDSTATWSTWIFYIRVEQRESLWQPCTLAHLQSREALFHLRHLSLILRHVPLLSQQYDYWRHFCKDSASKNNKNNRNLTYKPWAQCCEKGW